jgi:hypothetical protein
MIDNNFKIKITLKLLLSIALSSIFLVLQLHQLMIDQHYNVQFHFDMLHLKNNLWSLIKRNKR